MASKSREAPPSTIHQLLMDSRSGDNEPDNADRAATAMISPDNSACRAANLLAYLCPAQTATSQQTVMQRLVGAGLPDFYGVYLDQRLRTARNALALDCVLQASIA